MPQTVPYVLPTHSDSFTNCLPTEKKDEDPRDLLFEEAARVIVESQNASISMLQRRLSIGYARASKLMDQLKKAGIVGQRQHPKPRKVLIDSWHIDMILGREEHNCNVAHCDEHLHKLRKVNRIKRLYDKIINFLNKK